MSLKAPRICRWDQRRISFSLLTLPRVTARAVVTWRKAKSFGIRFDPADDRRHKVKEWIDAYLDS